MTTRRQALRNGAALMSLLATAGLIPRSAYANWNNAAFEAKSVGDVLKALGGSAPVESKEVALTAPNIAENGAVVPMTVATSLTGIKQLLVLVEKNPSALVAKFDVSDAVEANFAVRAKMGQSSDVYAVALANDGKAYFTKKEVKVTLGGCGG